MKIGFISSEIYPFTKTGGLGDVSYALPRELKKTTDISCITLLYTKPDKHYKKIDALNVDFPCGKYALAVYHTKSEGVDVYFLSCELFERERIYGTYSDNYLRFGLFAFGAVLLSEKLGFDILHINDWQSALVAYVAKRIHPLPVKVLLTIHNIKYQGVFPKQCVDEIGLLWEDFNSEGIEYFEHVNFLKSAIIYADFVTTVSPSYLEEIQTATYGFGLEGLVKSKIDKFKAVLNGIDTEVWNPKNDQFITHPYSADSIEEKKQNKTLLCRELGFTEENRLLFVMVARIVKEKGIDYIKYIVPFLHELEINFVIMGEGDGMDVAELRGAMKHTGNCKFIHAYDEALAHKLYAAAEFLVMPSLFEPCGLNQMIAFAYGTLPIVRKTGGLNDSVADLSSKNRHAGRGVVFKGNDTLSFYHAFSRALALYTNQYHYKAIVRENMGLELSWKNSVLEYKKIYQQMIGG